MVLCR